MMLLSTTEIRLSRQTTERTIMNRLRRVAVFALAALIYIGFGTSAVDAGQFSTSPLHNNGEKWRIGYYEGGTYGNYLAYLKATVKGLMELGWIEKREVPDQANAWDFWQWLSRNANSDYLEFPADAFYTAGWDEELRRETRETTIQRLKRDRDIDLIIAMGTWAGQDLANNEHQIPTIVMSSSDPVGSGIIESVTDSGYDHVHARVDPMRYERQVRVFHDIIGFKKLGVAFEDSVNGRSYAAIDLVEEVAKERGFEVIHCYTESDIADKQRAGRSVLECFRKLAKEVDAIYVTAQGGVNAETIPLMVRIANDYGVPTFSQVGSREVKYGFLLSISRAQGFQPVGMFMAATFAKVFNGAKPRELNQVFEEAPNLAINLKTAEKVGLYLYAEVLAASDEIYREIESPKSPGAWSVPMFGPEKNGRRRLPFFRCFDTAQPIFLLENNHRIIAKAIKPTRPLSPNAAMREVRLPTMLLKKGTVPPNKIPATIPRATSKRPTSVTAPSQSFTVCTVFMVPPPRC